MTDDATILRYLGSELEHLEAETPLPPPPRMPTPIPGAPRILHMPLRGLPESTPTVPPPPKRAA